MIYKFPRRRPSALPKLDTVKLATPEFEDPIGVVQGQIPDSKEEWWVAKALNRIGISYTYQYAVQGGRQRGGFLIDFLVDTVPLKTMIEPIGNHWHTGELGADDKKRQADIEAIMQGFCRIPIQNLWIPDLIDEETTFQRVQAILG